MTVDEFIEEIDQRAEKPFVTAQFGPNWKEHTKKQFDQGDIDIESIINIAWKQGRRAILLERELRDIL